MALGAHAFAVDLARRGDLPLAEEMLRFITRSDSDPNALTNLGTVLLAQGRYQEGARLYEARLAATDAPRDPGLPFPRWNGEPLDGKRVLVWPEQGFGDQIMFSRFVPGLRMLGCDVTLVCRPQLVRLFAASLDARVMGAEGSIDFPAPDVWMWSSSLLAAAGATLNTLPSGPYLHAPRATIPGARIGIVTSGSPTHANDANRSLPPELREELLALHGAIDLKPESTGASDFYDTARLIAGLDLVISVDTSVAHLAGALGIPVWIMLPAIGTDWRWLRERDDSPWYPTARLFRQPAPGDWPSVVGAVKRSLLTTSP